MCKYCDKMDPMMHTNFKDGTYIEATIVPSDTPYIYMEHVKPINESTRSVFADGFYIKYCPMCGRKLV